MSEMSALPSRIIYVNQNVALTSLQNGTSWANAYRELSAALNSLASAPPSLPVEVWVARGTYKPTLGRDRSVAFKLVSHVHIVGGFEGNETTFGPRKVKNIAVLSGDIGTADTNAITAAFPYNTVSATNFSSSPGFLDNSFNVVTIGHAFTLQFQATTVDHVGCKEQWTGRKSYDETTQAEPG